MYFIWFGENKPPYVDFSISTFKKINPDFEIFFINEINIRTSKNPYVIECLEKINDSRTKYYNIFHAKHFKGTENKSEILFSTAFSDALRFMIID